jgi:hypothetical protein
MRGRMIMLAAGMKMGAQRSEQQAQAQAQQQAAVEQAKKQGAEEALEHAGSAPATASVSAPASGGTDMTVQLQKLAELHKSGVLTDEEFAAAKKKLLGI